MSIYRVVLIAASLFLIITSPSPGQQRTTNHHINSAEYLEQSSSSPAYKPSVSQVGLQFGSGLLVGAAGGALSGLAGMALFVPDKGNSGSGFANMGAFVIGGTLGYTVSSALGIYWMANGQKYRAAYGSILLGSTIGTAAGLGSLALIGSDSAAIGLSIALAAPVIGSMIANGLSIKNRVPNATALLKIARGNATLGPPAIRMTKVGKHGIHSGISYVPTIKMLSISL